MDLGLSIKSYLEKQGITQAHISRETGIDPVKLNLALNGNRRLTFSEYELLCGALKLDMNFFLKPRINKNIPKPATVSIMQNTQTSVLILSS